MKILFAPDWRDGVPYQRLLAEALVRLGVEVDFLRGYKRILPLRRLLASRECDILHLHWPEAYYPRKGDAWDWWRRMRFPSDLSGALRRCRLATTAHNLHAHNRADEPFAKRNMRAAYAKSSVVFAHSEIAKQRLVSEFGLDAGKVSVIPHGDLAVTLGAHVPQAEARAQLGLGGGKLAVVFGAIEPYKGQEEIIAWWKHANPAAQLAIIGNPITPEYGAHLANIIGDAKNITARYGWLPDEQLRLWLSAADATIFNYRQIFTSGAANLARSWGLPMLLPRRLDTVVLDEPSPLIHRFESFDTDFATALDATFSVAPDFAGAAAWREAHRWDEVARITAEGYRRALGTNIAHDT